MLSLKLHEKDIVTLCTQLAIPGPIFFFVPIYSHMAEDSM